jgi:hypothetical protein
VLIVGGLVVFAAGGLLLVRRRFSATGSGEHNDAVTFLTEIVVGVYGIVLAFVIVTHYQDFADAEATVQSEATALVQLQRESGAFPTPVRERLQGQIGRYVTSVTDEEWRLMEDAEESSGTREEIGRLYGVLQRYAPRGPTESAFYDSAVGRLDDLVAARRDRLRHATQSLPGPFQVLIFGGAFAVSSLLWFFSIPSLRMQTALVIVVATLIGFNLLIAALLDHPFSGDLAVSTAPFEAVRDLGAR